MMDLSNPFRKQPTMRRLALPLAFIAVCLGWVCFKVLSARPGYLPSSFFLQLDRNHDSAVAFSEWKNYYEGRINWAGREWDFRFMDCNDDQRLTWWEYRAWTFRRQSCGKAMDIADRPRAPGGFSHCETDPVNHMQTCYVSDSSGEIIAPPAKPWRN